MQDGRIEQVGTPSELYERPRTRFAAGFLGKSNFLDLPDGTYALRPEKIDIAPSGQINGAARLTGTIRDITYFGAMQKYMVSVDGRDDIEVDVDGWRNPHDFETGQAVELGWADHAAVKLEES
jgi:putative spermidine/putrescine transport system ATP-binding protein